jgi:hypothetical protein
MNKPFRYIKHKLVVKKYLFFIKKGAHNVKQRHLITNWRLNLKTAVTGLSYKLQHT